MTEEDIIIPPNPARIMEGLRDTGYDFNTAMADIIDNSIAANATKVDIKIDRSPSNNINIYIADNGHGMDFEGLKNAMTYGSKERIDPSSLGKFGLGLKTASTAFCRSLSVVSKTETSDYNKVTWDLDEIAISNTWRLLHPEVDGDDIDLLEATTDGNAGTLVIWNKVDRLLKKYVNTSSAEKAFNKKIESLEHHVAMTFQRFIDTNYKDVNNVVITINDKIIKPWDPFCKNEKATTSAAKQIFKIEGYDGKFFIESWILPKKEDFSTLENYSKAIINNDHQGFYVYRENRLIHYGDWLGLMVNDPHFSLLRVDLSFDHTLDIAFDVDIKKSKITLIEDIADVIREQFVTAPRKLANELYRKNQTDDIKGAAENAHKASNKNIEEKAPQLEDGKVKIIDEKAGTVELTNSNGSFITDIITIKPTIEDEEYQRVIPVESIQGDALWKPATVKGKHAVEINQSHPFYTKVYAPNLDNPIVMQGLDYLLWSITEAELNTTNEFAQENYQDMRYTASKKLRWLVKDMPDPEINKEE